MSESGVPAGPSPLDISRYRFLGVARPDHDGAGLLGAKAHAAGGAVDAKGSGVVGNDLEPGSGHCEKSHPALTYPACPAATRAPRCARCLEPLSYRTSSCSRRGAPPNHELRRHDGVTLIAGSRTRESPVTGGCGR